MTIFEELLRRYKTNQKAAEAIGLPLRTFMDWKHKGFKRETRRRFAHNLIRTHLDSIDRNPPHTVSDKRMPAA